MHFIYFAETSVSEIEEAFLQFTNRSDIAILLINQNVRVHRICTDFLIQNLRLFPDFFSKQLIISFSRLKVIK